MRYSYTNVSTFAQCPRKWKYQYIDKLKTIPDTAPDNALWCGLAIHKGIEEWTVQAGLDEYKSHYNILTDQNVNWMIQIEYQLTKLLETIPKGGQHEVEVKTDRFVGYIDYIVGNEIWDWKFSNNVDNYLQSPQLSIYKHYLSVVRPDIQIDRIKFCFIPKINIRQKKDESLFEFRQRLQEHLEASEIKVVEVKYDEDSITQFEQACQILDHVENFPKNETKLCDWCQYEPLCKRGEDWMIL
jgi:hypothetical protein